MRREIKAHIKKIRFSAQPKTILIKQTLSRKQNQRIQTYALTGWTGAGGSWAGWTPLFFSEKKERSMGTRPSRYRTCCGNPCEGRGKEALLSRRRQLWFGPSVRGGTLTICR